MRVGSWIGKPALVLASTLATFALAEGILRFRGVPYDLTAYHADPALGYILRPNLHAVLDGVRHDYNRRGLRDRDYPDRAETGRVRVLALGDSVTFAQSLPLEATFPKRLERLLGSSGSGGSEILNGGVAGYNACQEEAFYRNVGASYQPDLVIWQYCLNDVDRAWNPYAVSNTGLIRMPAGLKRTLRENVLLWGFLRSRSYALMQQLGWMEDGRNASRPESAHRLLEHYRRRDGGPWDEAWGCVRRAFSEMKSRGQAGIVLVVPYAMHLDQSSGFDDAPIREVLRRCYDDDLRCISLLDTFRGHPAGGLYLLPDYVHLTARGHDVIAQAIAPTVRDMIQERAGGSGKPDRGPALPVEHPAAPDADAPGVL